METTGKLVGGGGGNCGGGNGIEEEVEGCALEG